MHQSNSASPVNIPDAIERVVVTREEIDRRLDQIAQRLTDIYQGRELTILAVLTGSLIFLADLIRKLPPVIPVRLAMVGVQSYPGRAVASQSPKFNLSTTDALTGRHVLILDDILDSGRTLKLLLETVSRSRPMSLQSCVLLRKHRPDVTERPDVDFIGFDIDNQFVVGYGLDYDNMFRNLPDICVLRSDYLEKYDK